MDLNFNYIDEIKERFARLLTYLYFDAKIEFDNISKALVESSFLDIFEQNKLNEFMSMQVEDMAKRLFPKLDIPLQVSNEDIGPVYWAGLQYMNILMNYRIPLRTLFILLPLKEMVNKFAIYHEINPIELCRDFISHEYKDVSILRYFRKRSNLSVRELSVLSGIPESTIKYLDNNDNFYNATNRNLEPLVKVLQIEPTFYKKKSSFIPVTHRLLTIKDFMVELSKTIGDYYLNGDWPNIQVKFYKEIDLDKGQAFLIVDNSQYLTFGGKNIYIDDNVFLSILDKTVDGFIEKNLKNNLVF